MKIYKTPNLWNSAKKLIPGGNGLLSKRPNRYLPDYWPTYFKKAKDINIKSINNKNLLICLIWVLEHLFLVIQIIL